MTPVDTLRPPASPEEAEARAKALLEANEAAHRAEVEREKRRDAAMSDIGREIGELLNIGERKNG